VPYDLSDFGSFIVEKPGSQVLPGMAGKDRHARLPLRLRKKLSIVSDKQNEDASAVDFNVFCDLLEARLSPEDALATFLASERGADAVQRHSLDWIEQRTFKKAMVKVKKAGMMGGVVSVDFGRRNNKKGEFVTEEGFVEERAELIETQKKMWLWRPYIPAGRITVIAGDPGLGKSTIAIDICSRISRGAVMPGDTERTQSMGSCAIATAEDHTAETIIPRLIAAGANRSRIKILRKMERDGERRYLSLPDDLKALHDYIVRKGIRLFVIDPLNAFLSAGTDTYKDHDVRLAMGPLEDIAEETGCAILIIAHLNKKEDASTLYRVGGSIGFIGAARSVLAVSKNEQDNADMKVLYSLKANLARNPPALQYRLDLNREVDDSYVSWHGQSTFDPARADKYESTHGRKESLEFLRQELLEGEMPSAQVYADALLVGITKRTLDRYKKTLGVCSTKRGEKWFFTRPEQWPKK
jgi:hypothetical protein